MIKYKHGNIFDAPVEAIVNTVNCVGVMGRGIALQFKKRYPENFTFYADACKEGKVVPGKMLIFDTQNMMNPRYIINFPTKRHWRGSSRMEDIAAGLKTLAAEIKDLQIKSIAIPPLGCGLGGLNWSFVKKEIENALGMLTDIEIEVYEPGETPAAGEMLNNTHPAKMTPGRAALIILISKYLAVLLDPFITLLEIHKLMYFLQESGEILRLKYVKYLYGPYAENLRHVLNAIEGQYISGYADGGDQPNKIIELRPGAIEEGELFLKNYPDTQKRMERVCSLVEGFETSFGLELLTTVHWLITREKCTTLTDIINAAYQWNQHKRQFSPSQIELATARLMQYGWVPPIPDIKAMKNPAESSRIPKLTGCD